MDVFPAKLQLDAKLSAILKYFLVIILNADIPDILKFCSRNIISTTDQVR